LQSGAVFASFPAVCDPAAVAAFLDEVERSDRYKVCILDRVPTGMEVSDPPVRDLPTGYP
jgi:hypothetical protein